MMGVQELRSSYDREKYRHEKAEYDEGVAVAEVLSNYANGMNRNSAGFVDMITGQHRTLQQSAMTLFLDCIYRWSESDSDMRNEATVKLCNRIKTEMEIYYEGKPLLPLI